MAPEELRAVVKAAVAEAMAEGGSCRRCCDTCTLEPGEHRDDHQFVQGCRNALAEGGKQAIGALVKGILAIIGLGILAYLGVKLGIHGK